MERSKFKQLDILGSHITFNVEKRQKFKSVFGAFLSLILISVSLILFIIYLLTFLKKENPSNSYHKRILDNKQNISGKNFFLLAGLVGPNSKIIQNLENKFIFSLRYFFYNSTLNGYDFNRIELISCSLSEKFNKLKGSSEALKSLLFYTDQSYFCVPDDYEFRDILGTGSPNNSTWYVMDLFPCNGTALKKTCVPYSDLEAEIPHYSLQLVYLDNLVDISDYKQPIKSFYKSYIFPGTLQSMTQENLEFNKLIIESDDSFLFEDIKTREAFSLKNREKNIFPEQGYDYRHKILFYVIDNHDVYFRAYLKLTTILAIIYSNLKVFSSVFFFLNEHLSNYDIVDYIFSFLYNFDYFDKNSKPSFSFRNFMRSKEKKEKEDNSTNNPEKKFMPNNYNITKQADFKIDKHEHRHQHQQKECENKKTEKLTNDTIITKNSVSEGCLVTNDNDYNHNVVGSSIHLRYFHNIKEKIIPKVKNMNKFFITRICCCKTFRDKRAIYKKMEFEVNDHLEIFNYITMSIILNNYMLRQNQVNYSIKLFNDDKNQIENKIGDEYFNSKNVKLFEANKPITVRNRNSLNSCLLDDDKEVEESEKKL